MRLLMDHKAMVNARNGAGATALMAAAASRNPRSVQLLLDSGADVNALTKRNESALANAACRQLLVPSRRQFGRLDQDRLQMFVSLFDVDRYWVQPDDGGDRPAAGDSRRYRNQASVTLSA
jgi:ankyrin repeat protein